MHLPISSGALLRHQLHYSLQRTGRHGPARKCFGAADATHSMHACTAHGSAVRRPEKGEHRITWNVPTFTHLMKSKKFRTLHQAPLTASDIQPRRHLLQH